jgi:hypothetical protein
MEWSWNKKNNSVWFHVSRENFVMETATLELFIDYFVVKRPWKWNISMKGKKKPLQADDYKMKGALGFDSSIHLPQGTRSKP